MELKGYSGLKNTSDTKPILAFETSENICGVCIYFSDDKYFSSSVNLKHSHSEKIFELTDFLFKTSGIRPVDLDAIAVSEGPGSFTGLRIGFSAAKGIAYGAQLPIIPVPTYEALAFQLTSILKDGNEFIISNKLNKEEVFFSRFQIRGNNYIFAEDLTILRKELFLQKSKDLKIFGNSAEISGSQILYPSVPDSLFIARWAVVFGVSRKTFDYDFSEPNYLKDFIIKGEY